MKIINRDDVEIDITKDLEGLRKIMMTMNLSNSDRQQFINLFSQMANNKETMYRETLQMSIGLTKLDTMADELLSNQDMLHGMQDETRMIMRYIKDQDEEMKQQIANSSTVIRES